MPRSAPGAKAYNRHVAGRIAWVLVAATVAGCAIDSSGHLARDGGARGSAMDGNTLTPDVGPMDTAPPRPDTGPGNVDAGPPAIDAGPPPMDSGRPEVDAGPPPPGFCPFIPVTVGVPSVTRYDTCGAGDDHRFVPVMGPMPPRGTCREAYPADGEDVVVRFMLDRPMRLRLVLVDDDPDYMIDTMIYVRTGACDATGTQVACNDDVDPEVSRTAANDRIFEAGEYFVVLDAYNGGGGWRRCGLLELRVLSP
jgi:hypothetical protein